jgi:hypothetical protein
MIPTDEQRRHEDAQPAPQRPAKVSRSLAFKLAALTLVVVSGLAGTGLARWLKGVPVEDLKKGVPVEDPKPARQRPTAFPERLFHGWPKPDLALLLSGQMHGYMLPCGCSHPQVGGLERRYNVKKYLEQWGWPVVAVDVGDVPQKQGPAVLPNIQGLLKYKTSMYALKAMGYTAVGVGEYEAAQPLFNALGEYALNEPAPRVLAANLLNHQEKFPGELRDWQLAEVPGLPVKVGVAGVVGPTVAKEIKDPALKFGKTPAALDKVLKEMAQAKVDLPVLLYQGYTTRGEEGSPPEAVALAQAYPQFRVILCASESDEPSGDPVWVTDPKTRRKTLIASVGHKGKYVGVVGVYRTGRPDDPFEMRYELVAMSEDYLTPKGQEDDHPIVKLMEAYTRELKRDNYLAKYGQSKHKLQVALPPAVPKYVGSAACEDCHPHAFKVWKDSRHNHAYQTLVDARRPSLRQYDPECIVCHTVGFGYQTGFRDAEKTPKLKDVGCENCHGPASEHVNNPNNPQWRALLNPWKAKENETEAEKTRREGRIDDETCQRCHDAENDVTYTNGGFKRKWPLIAHPTPKTQE